MVNTFNIRYFQTFTFTTVQSTDASLDTSSVMFLESSGVSGLSTPIIRPPPGDPARADQAPACVQMA